MRACVHACVCACAYFMVSHFFCYVLLSLPCVKAHKEKYACSGVRNKAEYVSLDKFSSEKLRAGECSVGVVTATVLTLLLALLSILQ